MAHPLLGVGIVRTQSGFPDGCRISWQHRSRDGALAGLGRSDVLTKEACMVRTAFCAQLSDQNRAPAFSSRHDFLLVIAPKTSRVLRFLCISNGHSVVGAAIQVPAVIRKKRSLLRELLGHLGDNLFSPTDWSHLLQQGFVS